MLPLSVVQEIERHLREGRLSQRKIAARLGVSRATVGDIASGRRGSHGRESDLLQMDDPGQLPPQRCSACGYLVFLPCVICQARDFRRRARRIQRVLPIQRPGSASRAGNRGDAATSGHSAVA